MADGQTGRICGDALVFAKEEVRTRQTGHAPYGMAIIRNPALTHPDDFVLLAMDDARPCSWIAFRYGGICFVSIYMRPRHPNDLSEALDRLFEAIGAITDPIILMGDFNARLRSWGDHAENSQGTGLAEYMDGMEFRRVSPSYGRWTYEQGIEVSIPDHIWANEEAFPLIRRTVVDEDAVLGGTDHHPILTLIKRVHDGPQTVNLAPKTWNRWALKSELARAAFRDFLLIDAQSVLSQMVALSMEDRDPLTLYYPPAAVGCRQQLINLYIRHYL